MQRKGEGPLLCGSRARTGGPCGNHEVDGLGACVLHVPDGLLEEAEQVTGYHRCRLRFGQPDACRIRAVKGTDPPRCKDHGANLGQPRSRQASTAVVEGRVTDRMIEIMAAHGDRLLEPAPVGNPLVELLALAGEMAEWKKIMQEVVAYLLSKERVRYAHDRVGEQLRAEVLIYERAIERLASLYVKIAKLGIQQQLVQIEAEQVRLIERALDVVLAKRGLGLVEQEEARADLAAELARAG
jgi:hypothetical protein